nr:MAG TPA: hypothetical protein [Bacteriophage sp.]
MIYQNKNRRTSQLREILLLIIYSYLIQFLNYALNNFFAN